MPASTEGARSFSASSSGSSASSASQSQLPVAEAGPGQVLPAPADGRGERAHGLEARVGERQRLELGLEAHPVLGGPRPVEVGQIGLLGDGEQRRRGVRDDVVLAEAPAPLGEQGDLVGHRDGGRVDVERARPRDLAVRGLGRQLDAAAAGVAGDAAPSPGPGARGWPPPPAARRPRRRSPPRRRPRRARPCRSRCRPPSSRAGRRAGGPSGCGCARRAARPPGSPRRRRARRRPARRARRRRAGSADRESAGARGGRPRCRWSR